jgi:8-oxo-dGTP pyrophosphatase MutT (NUDIX family)
VATPQYILDLRELIGTAPLLLPGVSAVLVREDLEPGRRHLLLTKRADNGRWSLPAGIVEPGEQPAAAIVREVAEETGVLARADRLALLVAEPETAYANGDRVQFIAMCFRCSYVSGEAVVADEESTEVGWFASDELPEDLDHVQRRRIACALSDQGTTVFDR